jgi:hypothetical protein
MIMVQPEGIAVAARVKLLQTVLVMLMDLLSHSSDG